MKRRRRRRLTALSCAVLLFALAVSGCGGKNAGNSLRETDDRDSHSIVETGTRKGHLFEWRDTEKDDDTQSTEGIQAGDGKDREQEESDNRMGTSGTLDSETGGMPGAETGNKPGGTDARGGRSGNMALSALTVDGTRLVDSEGNPVQLKGISTHGLAWYPGYVNADCFKQLKEEWEIDVIRLAMYTGESGGYCSGGDKDGLKSLIRNGVKYATDCGLYVIIDWHILSDGNPNTYIEESKAFFKEMSQEYADYTNVLYEICNEPNGGTSWSSVKTYAEQIIEVIRENDDDGIILVGTPNWCQYVDQAAADPIKDCKNVMYTLHFYAATHMESLRNTMVNAIKAGLPIFVSEYGICDASGNGAIDRDQAEMWVSLMDQYGVSYVAWNLSNKGETSALFKSSCNKLSGFTAEDLSDSGKWLYRMLTGKSPEQAGTAWTGGSDSGGTGTPAQQGGGADRSGSGSSGSPSQPGGSTGQSGQSGSGGSAKAGKTLTDKSGLEISAVVVNSWEQDGKEFCQYTLTVKNPTDTDCSSWTVELNFSGEISLESGWNGNYQVDGSRLTISSVDYNGAIPAGGSVGDVGFIVRGNKGFGL